MPVQTGTEVVNSDKIFNTTSNSTSNYTSGLVNPWYDYYKNARDKFGGMAQKTPAWTHGLMMWLAWTLCGVTQLVSARYMGTHYVGRVRLHMTSGAFMCMLTLLAALFAWSNSNFELKINYHSITGLIVVVQMPFAFVIAFGAYSTRYGFGEWNVKFVEMLSDIHKYHGYTLIGISQVAVCMGLAFYLINLGKTFAAIGFIVANLALFGAVIAWLEVNLQKTLSAPKIKLISSDKVMSQNEFLTLLKEGRMLAILEGQVLDLEPYIGYHPGGMFVL